MNNHTGNTFVRRKFGEEWRPACLTLSVWHPASVTVWGHNTGPGVGFLEKCEGTINREKYISMLNRKMLPSAMVLFPEGRLPW